MYPTVFRIGFFSIKTYGIFLAAAFFLGMRLAVKKTSRLGISEDDVGKLFLWIIVSGLVGARILYVFTEGRLELSSPLSAFRIWEGGLHYYGGFAGAVAAVVLFSLRHKGFDIWKFADAASASLAMGLAVGKIGCFFAGCCFGRECSLPWAVVFTRPDSMGIRGLPLHPTQIYEAAVYFVIFGISEFLYRALERDTDGELFWFTVFLLSFARFHLEFMRWEDSLFLGLSSGGIASAITAATALACMTARRLRSRASRDNMDPRAISGAADK
ncbi:MAG: prolipoprotein diacylglyceryl transferase [Endomicrobiia bacterium]|nr:prolipoprotein diacylglyceryl transferase [Endomicrobiia bacterium]